jgi:hypothetical protein
MDTKLPDTNKEAALTDPIEMYMLYSIGTVASVAADQAAVIDPSVFVVTDVIPANVGGVVSVRLELGTLCSKYPWKY